VTEKLPRKTPKILCEGAPIPARMSARSVKVESGFAGQTPSLFEDRAANKKRRVI
jgi:hypothetical protein